MSKTKGKKKPKVVILAGGKGMRLREETEYKPKPMVMIGPHPILWHIMKLYMTHGFDEFIICLGYKGHVIKNYFLNYEAQNNDFTLEVGSQKSKVTLHRAKAKDAFKVTLIDTGPETLTGGRLKQIEKYIDTDYFMLTYGDGVANVNIKELVDFHKKHGKIGTVTGVHPESRFGELVIKEDRIEDFAEKPQVKTGYINGGFFVFSKKFFKYLKPGEDCFFERAPLKKLSADDELRIFKHDDFWQCMDTMRDFNHLNKLWDEGKPEWKVW